MGDKYQLFIRFIEGWGVQTKEMEIEDIVELIRNPKKTWKTIIVERRTFRGD